MDYVPRKQRKICESNTRIVEWTDGTKSLAIGDEFFDIDPQNLQNTILTFKHEDLLIMKAHLKKKAILKPAKHKFKIDVDESKHMPQFKETNTSKLEEFLADLN